MKRYTFHNDPYGEPHMEPDAKDCEQFYLASEVAELETDHNEHVQRYMAALDEKDARLADLERIAKLAREYVDTELTDDPHIADNGCALHELAQALGRPDYRSESQ